MKKQKQKTLPTTPTDYPAGSFVRTAKGFYYIASENKRFKIISLRCLQSWSPQRIIDTTEAAVSRYQTVAKLKFRNNSLIYSISDGKIYLISEGKRRHIQSPDVLDRLNLSLKEVINVSLDDINLHAEGEPLT